MDDRNALMEEAARQRDIAMLRLTHWIAFTTTVIALVGLPLIGVAIAGIAVLNHKL